MFKCHQGQTSTAELQLLEDAIPALCSFPPPPTLCVFFCPFPFPAPAGWCRSPPRWLSQSLPCLACHLGENGIRRQPRSTFKQYHAGKGVLWQQGRFWTPTYKTKRRNLCYLYARGLELLQGRVCLKSFWSSHGRKKPTFLGVNQQFRVNMEYLKGKKRNAA